MPLRTKGFAHGPRCTMVSAGEADPRFGLSQIRMCSAFSAPIPPSGRTWCASSWTSAPRQACMRHEVRSSPMLARRASPQSTQSRVRYIKLGPKGTWARVARDRDIIPFGSNPVPHEIGRSGDFDLIRRSLLDAGYTARGAAQAAREIAEFYTPSGARSCCASCPAGSPRRPAIAVPFAPSRPRGRCSTSSMALSIR